MNIGSNAEEFVKNMLQECNGADEQAWFCFWLSQPLGELAGRCPRDCLRDELDRRNIYQLFFGHAGLRPGRAPTTHEKHVRTADGGWSSRTLVRTPDGYGWVAAA